MFEKDRHKMNRMKIKDYFKRLRSFTSQSDPSLPDSEGGYKMPSIADSLFYMIFLTLFLPSIIGFITDAFHLRLLSEADLTVLSLTNSIDSITMILCVLFPIGSQAVISKALGRGDRESVSVDYTSITIGQGILVAAIAILMIAFAHPIAELLGSGDSPGMMNKAAMTIGFFAVGMAIECQRNLLYLLLYMEDTSRRGILYSALAGSFFNIVSYVLVTLSGPTLFKYLLAGLMSDVLSLIVILVYKRRKSRIFRFDPKLFSIKSFLHITNVGLPAGAEYLYVAIFEFLVIRYTIAAFSHVYLPVFEIEDDLNVIAETFVMAMCLILVYRLGIVCGEGNKDRIKKEIKNTWIVCMSLSVVVAGVCLIVYPHMVEYIVGDLGKNTALIKDQAVIDLYFVCLGVPFYAANNIFTSVYEVRELVKHAHLNYLLETCVLYIFYSVVLSQLLGVTGLWIAYPAAEATTLLVNVILMILYNKRLPAGWMDLMFPGPDNSNITPRKCEQNYELEKIIRQT